IDIGTPSGTPSGDDAWVYPLAEAIPHIPGIRVVSLDFQYIGLEAAIALAAAICTLDLDAVWLGSEWAHDTLDGLSLGHLLCAMSATSSMPSVTEVSTGDGCLLSSEATKQLAGAFKRGLFPNVKEVDVHSHPSNDMALCALYLSYTSLAHLEKLVLGNCACMYTDPNDPSDLCTCVPGPLCLDALGCVLPKTPIKK
ncbi:hypothetical protein KIPB_013398, partial [Kipferlia bialata]